MSTSTTGLPVASTASSSSRWRPGSSSVERDAASPIMSCDLAEHDHGDVRRRAPAPPPFRARPRRSKSGRGLRASSPGTSRTSTGTSRGGMQAPGAYVDLHARADLGAQPASDRHRLFDVVVEASRAERVAPRVGERADHRDRLERRRGRAAGARPRCAGARPSAPRPRARPRGAPGRRAPAAPRLVDVADSRRGPGGSSPRGPAARRVECRGVDLALGQRLRQAARTRRPRCGRSSAISMSMPALQRARRRVAAVARRSPCVARSCTPIASLTTKPLNPQVAAQHVGEQPAVAGRGDVVEVHVGAS